MQTVEGNHKKRKTMDQTKIRISGILLLMIFIIGVINYQFLRGPIVFSDDYLSITATNQPKIVFSILLSFISGVMSIVVSLILFEYFRRSSSILALTYVAFAIINFIGLTVENIAVFSVLEVSREFIENIELRESSAFISFGDVFYGFHKWAHYSFLLLSCLPVFILFYSLYKFKYVPKLISVIGMIAVILMFIDVVLLMTEVKFPIDLLLPIGLVQLVLPFWLIIKGFYPTIEKAESR